MENPKHQSPKKDSKGEKRILRLRTNKVTKYQNIYISQENKVLYKCVTQWSPVTRQ